MLVAAVLTWHRTQDQREQKKKKKSKTALHVEKLLVVELSNGQMVEDVKLTLEGRRPVEFYGRVGGNVPGVEELLAKIEENVGAAA